MWANNGESGQVFYTTSIVRSYNDGNEWKETNTFMPDHLPKLELVVREAFKFICMDARDPNRSAAPPQNGDAAEAAEKLHPVVEEEEQSSPAGGFSGRESRRRGGEKSR